MQWMVNLSTRTNLLLGFFVIIVVVIVVTIVACPRITNVDASQRRFFEREFAIVNELMELCADQHRQRAHMLEMIISAGLLALERDSAERTRPEQIETVFRHAHSLKGATHTDRTRREQR